MILQSLRLNHFRNLADVKLELHPRCNVFVAGNGHGKTSILEAIYLLSRGQSFRTHITAPLIQFECFSLAIKAVTEGEDILQVEKNVKGLTKIHHNEKRCQRLSDLTHMFPCQIFHQDLFQIIDSSSQIRRRLLDWGVFYAYPEYGKLFQDFKRVLLQRNSLLKQKGSTQALQIWNDTFVEISKKITTYRLQYLERLITVFNDYVGKIADLNCQMSYFNGWDKHQQQSLSEVLLAQEAYDRKMMFTHSGPHHADLLFLTTHGKGKLEWSRGQQKMILIMLKLAQATLLERPCMFLLDDFMAELDKAHIQDVYQQLKVTHGQLFLTALDDSAKNEPFFADSRWFYLSHGQLNQVIEL